MEASSLKSKQSDRRYTLQCVSCAKVFTEEQTATSCLECNAALDVVFDYDYIKSKLNYHALRHSPISASKYVNFYPLEDLSKVVSLSEGGTPLHHAKNLGKNLGLKNLYIKNEGANPTGVFKDRGSLVEITKAIELGAKAICCASTGNMAASVSAYAAIAKIPCYVLVPEGTPVGKLAQSLIYGARILQIRGTYADCCVLAENMAKNNNFYLAGDYVFRSEGQKSCSYEIVEQLFWKVPDFVLVPVGCGTNIAAIWKGFWELKLLGIVDKVPRMIAVQPDTVPTIVEAFRKGQKHYVEVEKPASVASAVGIGKPLDDIKALNALYDSNGDAESAAEIAILEAEKALASEESLFVEPSSALPIACLPKLIERGVIKEDDVVVCIATGIGLKDPKSATAIMPDPPVLEPVDSEINNYLENKLYEIRAVSVSGKATMLWEENMPNSGELSKIIKDEFNLQLAGAKLLEVEKEIRAFHEKTNKMKKADLQYIVENVLKEFTGHKRVFVVDDYKIDMTRHAKPVAKVFAAYKEHKLEAEAEGTGPVDALINAANQAIAQQDKLGVSLTTYNVEIKTGGTDAVVEVRMGLKSKKGTEVNASATSPDIIVASIEAFEKGYNILYYKDQESV